MTFATPYMLMYNMFYTCFYGMWLLLNITQKRLLLGLSADDYGLQIVHQESSAPA